jgi:homoprotocatechuate degradation regulator HpaR
MAQKSLIKFKRSLPMSLLRAREVVMKKFLPTLKEHGLTSQQWRVIRALEEVEWLDISELSKHCYLLMPSLSRIIQNLDGRGIVSRKPVPGDQRRSAISLTSEGRKLFSTVAPKSVERYEHIAEKYGAGKLELLYELLDDLVEKIDEDLGDGQAL